MLYSSCSCYRCRFLLVYRVACAAISAAITRSAFSSVLSFGVCCASPTSAISRSLRSVVHPPRQPRQPLRDIGLVDDRVAPIDGFGAVPRDLHRDRPWYAGPLEVAHGRAAPRPQGGRRPPIHVHHLQVHCRELCGVGVPLH